MHKDKSRNKENKARRFGTFGGVFTPSVLTILGVIMFLRYAQVVGYAGLWYALLILLASKAISLITGLSLSSISTNMQVRGGGAYYLISRSLGVEFGSVIAIFFYVAQAVAVTLYVMGFTEALLSALPDISISFQIVALLTNIVVFLLVYIGAGWTIRIQYVILAVLMISIISFFIGAFSHVSPELLRANLQSAWTSEYGFFAVFALFFPAVTGIMAGVNMSGDLKQPNKSIPRGTIYSIAFTFLIYVAVAVLLAASNPRTNLLDEGFTMKNTAWSPMLIYAGVISATLSSALTSMMGAPRIIQAFSRDRVFEKLKFLGKGSGPSNEPRRAILLTFAISTLAILAGNLNTVATVITMFFLLTYGTVNLACFYEIISRNPSFRPSFRANHWIIALSGALACLGVMFLISFFWAFIAILLGTAIYYYILRREIKAQWGDMNSGLAFKRARKALLKLEQEKYHPKNWRPSILVLSGGKWNRSNLLHYACHFSANRGIVSLAQILVGDLENRVVRREEAERLMRKFISKENLPAFPVAVVDENFSSGFKAILQVHGIGGLRPNTVLLGWTREEGSSGVFPKILGLAKKMQRNLLVVRSELDQENWVVPSGTINIWWNDARNSQLSLLMVFLLQQNPQWRDKSLRILRPAAPKADLDNIRTEMEEMLKLSRIEAEIILLPGNEPLASVRENLHSSAILFVGFNPEEDENAIEKQQKELAKIMKLPGEIVLVHNAGKVSPLD